jgi:DNA adenine methylase
MILRSPVTWIGGKGKMLKHVLPLVSPYAGERQYVEVFGGSGIVLLNKQPHESEVYNDKNNDLANLFRVLRCSDLSVHLWWELFNTPVSRTEFAESSRTQDDPVKAAASFVVRCRQRIGGARPAKRAVASDWGLCRSTSTGGGRKWAGI